MNCSKLNCTCLATKRPVLTFASKRWPKAARARAEVGLVVCDTHAVDDVAEYVTDAGWAQIVATLRAAGKAEPSRESLQVHYLALN